MVSRTAGRRTGSAAILVALRSPPIASRAAGGSQGGGEPLATAARGGPDCRFRPARMLRWLALVLLLAAACSTSSVSAAQPDEPVHAIHLGNPLAEPLGNVLRAFLEGDAVDADGVDGSAAVRSGDQPRGEVRLDVVPK